MRLGLISFQGRPMAPGEAKLHVVTPVGNVAWDAHLKGRSLADVTPTQAWRLGNGGSLSLWKDEAFRAEFLLCRPKLSLPPGYSVDDCWGGLWRVRANTAMNDVSFSCRWEQWNEEAEGGADCGEYLAASTWEAGGWKLSIGTDDDEALAHRSYRGESLPARWFSRLDIPYGLPGWTQVLKNLDNGWEIILPPLERDDVVQIYFLAAWGRGENDETGFAVDAGYAPILGGAYG